MRIKKKIINVQEFTFALRRLISRNLAGSRQEIDIKSDLELGLQIWNNEYWCKEIADNDEKDTGDWGAAQESQESQKETSGPVDDGFILISGGSFMMGSPESENWRSGDELQHDLGRRGTDQRL